MAKCWISFRIAKQTVGGRSYDKRYDDLEKTILEESSTYWKEATSFIIFETVISTKSIALKLKKTISVSHDIFLIRNLDAKTAYICGKNDDDDIYELMDYLEEV